MLKDNVMGFGKGCASSKCCKGDEILCVSIPCRSEINLLGYQLIFEIPCLKLTTTNSAPLTELQLRQLRELIENIISVIRNAENS